jgi:hypothetical protein
MGEYLAQLEEAVRTWWKAVGPADNLPYQHGRLVDPSGPADGERWPSNNFLASQIRTLWALERAERTFGESPDVAKPARRWLNGKRATHSLPACTTHRTMPLTTQGGACRMCRWTPPWT